MAPKKKPQKQSNRKPASSSASSSKTSQTSSSAPRLQLSAENENRLRRLLLNSGHSAQSQADPNPAQDSLSKAQKAKKLKAVYENLSCEGFSNDQIELVLSSLKVISFAFNFYLKMDYFSILSYFLMNILFEPLISFY